MEGVAPAALSRGAWGTSLVMEPVLSIASRSTVVLSGGGGGGGRVLDVDDGGCDVSAGYVSHAAVRAALRADGARHGAPPGPHVTVSGAAAAAAAFPAPLRARAPSPLTLVPCHVMTTRLRTQHKPLRNQSDFIAAKQVMESEVAKLQGSLPRVTDFALLGLPPPAPGAPARARQATSPTTSTPRGHPPRPAAPPSPTPSSTCTTRSTTSSAAWRCRRASLRWAPCFLLA